MLFCILELKLFEVLCLDSKSDLPKRKIITNIAIEKGDGNAIFIGVSVVKPELNKASERYHGYRSGRRVLQAADLAKR